MNKLRTVESPVGAEVVLDGRRYINFSGSPYLGLSANARLLEEGIAVLRDSGFGYQLPRHYHFATSAHQEAELEAATFFDSQAALYLPGGYYFGLVSIAAMREKISMILFDEWAHYSLREAIAASGLPSHAFRHLDAEDLEAKLKRQVGAGQPLIVTDGLFSTFGEIAPLDELARVASPYGGRLLVDESHSFGVLGKLGRGAGEHHNLDTSSIVVGGSTGKAFGVLGGIIPGTSEEVASFRATPAARGASGGMPASAAMCARNLRYVRQHPELLQRLRTNVKRVKGGLQKLGLDVGDNVVPIAAFVTTQDKSMAALQERLMLEGIVVLHSTYIGASARGVIRCSIFADHSNEHIDRLIDTLRRLL